MEKTIIIDRSLTEESWRNYVARLRDSNDLGVLALNPDEIFKILSKQIDLSFKEILPKRFALLFSGGIDSTLIAYLAKRCNREFVCITSGFLGSHDFEYSKRVSKFYGFNHELIELNTKKIEKVIPLTKKIINSSNYVKISVGSVFVSALHYSKVVNDYKYIISGLGSEEIFAGYQRHQNASSINEECWNGLFNLFERDLSRDISILANYHKDAILPFLSGDLISLSMRIPAELKIKDSVKKYCLRKASILLGLKEEFSKEPKRAAQYGSNVDKEIERLAKAKNFSKSEYVKSL